MIPKEHRARQRDALTRRQSQVMRVLHAIGQGSVADVQTALRREKVSLSYASVKSALRGLAREEWLRTSRIGRATVYHPRGSHYENARSAVSRWIRTFFQGDSSAALITFLDAADADLPPSEIARLRRLLDPPPDDSTAPGK